MTMILLQLNVSHFGQKYLQNNGVDKMAGLRTNASLHIAVTRLYMVKFVYTERLALRLLDILYTSL